MSEKTFYIKTYGCQMNGYDSERMAGLARQAGYVEAETADSADVVIINTCSVREKPAQKVRALLGRLAVHKRSNPHVRVGVTGCVAQQEGQNLLKSLPVVDFVIGTDAVGRLGEILDVVDMGSRVCDVGVTDAETLSIPPFIREGGVSAYTTIMKGCDNFCSYCIVPHVRGREKSREPGEIMDEIAGLAENGVREVTLLGQNVNSYGKSLETLIDFPDLLHRVADVENIARIRFITSHPKDASIKLFDAVAAIDPVCEYLHLPLQSGSNRMLSAMNRGYDRDDYLGIIREARARIPGVAFSSDFIVGFPGETDEDFADTMDAIRTVGFEGVFAFKYSVRPGTAAAPLGDTVADEAKTERLNHLLDVQRRISMQRAEALVGTDVEVLVEGASKMRQEEHTGRSRTNRVVNFTAATPVPAGTITRVRIVEAKKNSLYGRLA